MHYFLKKISSKYLQVSDKPITFALAFASKRMRKAEVL